MAGKANPRFEQALAFAAQAHAAVHQERKGTDFPYVAHPIRVAEILDRFGCSEDVIVAGFLHDTIEDTDVTAEEISAAFGPRVAGLVTAVSEPDKSLPWKTRKQHTIEHLEQEAGSGGACAGGRRQARQRPRDHRHAASSRAGEDVGALQSGPERAALVLPAHRGDSARKDPESRLFRTLDFETQTLFPDQAALDDLLRREAARHPSRRTGIPRRPDQALASRPLCARARHELDRRRWLSAEVVRRPLLLRHLGGVPARRGLVRAGGRSGYERTAEPDRPARAGPAVRSGYGVIAVEGKAREPFGPLVSEWNDSPGKQARLESLCEQLGLDPVAAGGLYYQLLHRTVSAIREARRYGAREALMLVHSFDAG